MPNSPRLPVHLAQVNQLVAGKLGGLSELLPPIKPRLPFPDYLARAEARAASDPVFKQQYEQAKAQYVALGGKINGPTR